MRGDGEVLDLDELYRPNHHQAESGRQAENGMLAFHHQDREMGRWRSMAEPIIRNAIGPQVQKQRAKQKLTQQDLAGRCHILGFEIGRESVSQIERRTRGVSDLEMILLARALRIDIADLIPSQLPKWKKDLRPPNAQE